MQLSGLIPATVTPFAADGIVDADALDTHLRRLCEVDGPGGIAVNMDTALAHLGEVPAARMRPSLLPLDAGEAAAVRAGIEALR